jgi:hypothetical protein
MKIIGSILFNTLQSVQFVVLPCKRIHLDQLPARRKRHRAEAHSSVCLVLFPDSCSICKTKQNKDKNKNRRRESIRVRGLINTPEKICIWVIIPRQALTLSHPPWSPSKQAKVVEVVSCPPLGHIFSSRFFKPLSDGTRFVQVYVMDFYSTITIPYPNNI